MTESAPRSVRIETGIPGLDAILKGGFMKGGTYIVQGPPGTGKTILANQMCFRHIAQSGRALYVTLLAESNARMLSNLAGMKFYRPELLPEALTYLGAFRVLEEEGLKALALNIRRELQSHKSTLLIVDGLVSAEESAGNDLEFKKFIHDLQTQNSLVGCTSILLTSGGSKIMRPERTMVDGLIELSDQASGSRRERRIEVTKFRGSGYLRGEHAFEITDEGVVIYPRLEALLERPTKADGSKLSTVKSGVPDLDRMLGGGYAAGMTGIILGPSGSGKTSLGLSFLNVSSESEPGIYVSFYESPERASAKAQRLGIDLAGHLRRGTVEFLWQPTTEGILDAVGARVLAAIRARKAKRLFVDGMDGLRQIAFAPERMIPFFSALAHECRGQEVTTLYTAETHRVVGPELEAPPMGISTVIETLILLRFTEVQGGLHRMISVLKVRDGAHDSLLRDFTISDKGFQIHEGRSNYEGLLTGTPHKQETKRTKPDEK